MSTGVVVPRKPRVRPPILKVSSELFEQEQPKSIEISQVTCQIFMSGYEAAKSYEILSSNSITHILNLAGESKCPNKFNSSFHYFSLRMPDNPHIDILFFLYFAIEFILESVRNNGKILIHCVKGTSRSATVSLAYLMLQGYSEQEAYRFLNSVHPSIDPNLGFVCQLKELKNDTQEPRVFYYSKKYDMFVNTLEKEGSSIVIDKNSCTLYLKTQDSQGQIDKALACVHLWEKFNCAQALIFYL